MCAGHHVVLVVVVGDGKIGGEVIALFKIQDTED